MEQPELEPLENGVPPRPRPHPRYCGHLANKNFFRGPLRICRLLALLIVLPSLFIFIPLYMSGFPENTVTERSFPAETALKFTVFCEKQFRYRVFQAQMYPMSMTDMRLIDSKISPTWCQRQVVRSNTTFNAFVMPGPPELAQELVPVSMTRELELEDDMKEYWGFYLLKGSTVTVSACVNHPGASLIMIKGYRHLKDCAYIGDDSSEELDELLEANKLGLLSNTTLAEKILELGKINGKTNDPGTMKRHKVGVSFLDPRHSTNVTSLESVPAVDVTDHDPKELREILERLHAIRQAAKTETYKHYQPPDHLLSLKTAQQRHRDTNVDKEERQWLSFKDLNGSINDESSIKANAETETTSEIDETSRKTTSQSANTPPTESENNVVPTKTEESDANEGAIINQRVTNNVVTTDMPYSGSDNKIVEQIGNRENDSQDKTNGDVALTQDNTRALAEASSQEVFENILHQLQELGPRGARVLNKLHEKIGANYTGKRINTEMSAATGNTDSEEKLDHLRKVLVEAIDEEKTRPQRQQQRRDVREAARVKRDLMLGQIQLEHELNEDDEARDNAAEEGVDPDGYAEHHEVINETTPFDMSNSEYWSSFSSSEEALLECEGLILNLPMTPHKSCVKEADEGQSADAARANALTYRVPANGYYFFVFNSENERQKNFIRAKFDLQKTRYEVAKTALRECRNSTQRCDLLLDIFSSQKVVLEVPLRNNASLWNEQFVVVSECEPRTSVYLACVIAVPLLIMIFAFQ